MSLTKRTKRDERVRLDRKRDKSLSQFPHHSKHIWACLRVISHIHTNPLHPQKSRFLGQAKVISNFLYIRKEQLDSCYVKCVVLALIRSILFIGLLGLPSPKCNGPQLIKLWFSFFCLMRSMLLSCGPLYSPFSMTDHFFSYPTRVTCWTNFSCIRHSFTYLIIT